MRHKHSAIAILTYMLICSITAYGQNNKENKERDTTNQWEIGLDLLWLIDKNEVPTTSLFARYNFANNNGQKRAWRLRLGIDNSLYDSAQMGESRTNEIDIISPYVRIGHEWQQDISSISTTFFLGFDISTLYSQYTAKINLFPDNLLQSKDKTWEFGVIPFIGFKYRPVKWLAISTESSFSFIYRIRSQKDKVTRINYPDSTGGQSAIDVNDFTFGIQPISVINFCYYIN